MSQFQIHTIESAPEEAKDALKAVQNANGFIPNLIGVLANAPTALETYRGINGRNSLTGAEREVVQITAAVVNGCGFCVAGHTKIALKVLKLEEDVVKQIRATARIESVPKLDTLARFTLAVMLQKAKLTEAQLNEFFAAGYTQQHAIDVILGVSLATLCNYANNIAETPINPELQPFA